MEIKSVKDKYKVRKKLNKDKSSAWVEQDVLVPDVKPDILKVINVSSIPFVEKVETAEGKAKIKGKINSYILYESVEEKDPYRVVTYSYPYTEVVKIPNITEKTKVDVDVKIRNSVFQIPNERKVNIKNELVFTSDTYREEEIEIIKSLEENNGAEILKEKIKIPAIKYKENKEVEVREEIVLDSSVPDIDEIVIEKHNIDNIEHKKNYNKVILKGDIEGYLVYTSKNTDKRINKETFRIPFTTYYEVPEIKDNYNVDFKVDIVNFYPRKNTDNVTSSSVIIDANVMCKLIITENVETEVLKDMYFLNKSENLINKELDLRIDNKINVVCDYKNKIKNILEPEENVIDYLVDSNNITCKCINKNCFLEGTLKLNILSYNLKTKKINSKHLEMQVEYKKEITDEIINPETNIVVNNMKINVDGEYMNISADIEANILNDKNSKVKVIDKIEAEDLDKDSLDDITIYIVKPHDTLWSIAKKYKTTMQNILDSNNIPNKDKLKVGEKIVIIR